MRSRNALRAPRVPFSRSLAVTPESGAELPVEPLQLQAVNLSRGGLFVRADDALPTGTRVSLALTVGGQALDLAEGEVAWVRARGMSAEGRGFGVRFTRLRPKAQALVDHLVARGGTGEWSVADGSRSRTRTVGVMAGVLLAAAGFAAAFFVYGLRHPPASPPTIVELTPPPATLRSLVLTPVVATQAAVLVAPPSDFDFTLPTGAISSLHIGIHDADVTVMPALHRGTVIRRVFSLPHPSRLVIDVAGRQPRYSWQLEGNPVVKSVRVGARNHGTRVVVDLPELTHGKRYHVVSPPMPPAV